MLAPGGYQAGTANLFLAMSLAKVGRTADALSRIEAGMLFDHPSNRYLAALTHAEIGNSQESVGFLRRAVEERPFWIDLAVKDVGFERIRNSAEFTQLVEELR